MKDYLFRLMIVGIVAFFVSLLFLGGIQAKALEASLEEQTENWIWPADGVITDTFGTRKGHHKGIDIAAQSGSPVFAVDNGIVTKSYFSDSYGNVIFIRHQNNTETIYAHLKERIAQAGQAVELGEKIGSMGNTGDSSGVHLHFEMHKTQWTYDKENAIDPFIAFGQEQVGQPVHANLPEPSSKEVTTTPIDHDVEQPVMKESYTVQIGDTLTSIALKNNLTVAQLKKVNQLQDDLILIGQQLMIQLAYLNLN